MYSEDQLLPISALQHYIYCPRQCGLIHLERAWAENRFTAEGKVLHKNAHEGGDETRPGIRITRSLPVRSLQFGLSGQCDIVEFHDDGSVIAVEYKRGKPKAHKADEVQLCAQTLCLEEMLKLPAETISTGYIYYGKNRRRTEVNIDDGLRTLTLETAEALHEMIYSAITPLAKFDAKRCGACSLIELCEPKAMRLARGTQVWFEKQIEIAMQDTDL